MRNNNFFKERCQYLICCEFITWKYHDKTMTVLILIFHQFDPHFKRISRAKYLPRNYRRLNMLAGRLIAEVNQSPGQAITNCSWETIAFSLGTCFNRVPRDNNTTRRRTERLAQLLACVERRHTNGRGGDLVYTNMRVLCRKNKRRASCVPIHHPAPKYLT